MVSNRIHGLLRLISLSQVAVATALFAALFFVMDLMGQFGGELRDRYVWYWFVAMLSLLVAGSSTTLDPSRSFSLQLSRANLHRQTLRLTFSVTTGLMLFLVASKDQGAISRQFLFIYLILLHPALFVAQWVLPRHLAGFVLGKSRRDRALVIGAPGQPGPPDRLSDWLALKSAVGIEAAGLLSPARPAAEPAGEARPDGTKLPWLGTWEDLDRVIREQGVTQAIIADLPALGDLADRMIQKCEAAGVRVIIYCDFPQRLRRNLVHFLDDGLHFVATRSEPLENPFNRAVKRAFDVAFASVVVVLALPPVAVLVWIMQRIQSPGPLLHRQKRSGLNNRQFEMLKFRTMRTGHGEEARQAAPGDDRVYPFGRFLRRFSLDELPQFINVLRGEMSVVGPRPHLPEHNAQFAAAFTPYHLRSWVKPGITGLAQVRGHRGPVTGPEDVRQRAEADIEYLENWQLLLDVDIVVRTIGQMFFPPPKAL